MVMNLKFYNYQTSQNYGLTSNDGTQDFTAPLPLSGLWQKLSEKSICHALHVAYF